MSRSGYTDDLDDGALGLWRGAVKKAIEGRRGQEFLRELAQALDAMPEKVLIADDLEVDGQFCALGALGRARGLDMAKLDTWNCGQMAKAFGIAKALAAEVMYENDEGIDVYARIDCKIEGLDVAAERWRHMRAWALENLKTQEGA